MKLQLESFFSRSLHEQQALFYSVCQQSERQPMTFTVANDPQNRRLNRYCNVLAPDHSRILLRSGSYINANSVHYQHLEYICGQYPLPPFDSFFDMLYEQKVPMILCLAKANEHGKVKGHVYWPKEVGASEHGLLLLQEEALTPQLILRKLRHLETGHEFSLVEYLGWPDFGVCSEQDLLQIIAHVRRLNPSKMYVHCSAGIGRTGVFLVIDVMLQLWKAKKPLPLIPDLLLQLRSQRPGLVQQFEQFKLIYTTLWLMQQIEDNTF
jgi:protein tyrosine phosphatase